MRSWAGGTRADAPCSVTPVAVVLMLTCFLMFGALYTMGLGLNMLLTLPLLQARGDAKPAILLEGDCTEGLGGHEESSRSRKLSL